MFQVTKIRHFNEPAPQNCEALIEAVKERIKELEIGFVIVASDSGTTALQVAEALSDTSFKIACVTAYARLRLAWPQWGKWPSIASDTRKRLEALSQDC